MDFVLLMARLILAFVFGVAGVAKAVDPAGTRRALTGFGVPERLAVLLWWALPAVEILVALALVPLPTAWVGAIGALALLLIFSAVIGINLARGQSPDCHCFGQLHSEPVSWSVFARNLLLAAVAALIVARGQNDPGLSALGWLRDLRMGELVSLIFSVLAAGMLFPMLVLLRRTLKQQTTLVETVTALKKVIDEDYGEPSPVERADALAPEEGLPVGAPAPAFSLAALDGKQVSLNDLLAYGRSVLLLFVSPNCSPCKSLLPAVRVWERDYGDLLTIALLSKGTEKEVRAKLAKHEIKHLLLQGESKVADEFQARWTPAAMLISPDGKVASQVTNGDEAIRTLLNHTVTVAAANNELAANTRRPRITLGNSLFKVGEPAPAFSLPDLNGQMVNSEDLLGRDTLLLFWDAQCPHCLAMFDDLKRWEENPPPGAPGLVYIVSGDAKEAKSKHRELRSLTLLDEEFDAGPLFGSSSTPSAVLIDSEGRIASSLAKGAKNILPLIGVRKIELPIAPNVARSAANGQIAADAKAEMVAG